MFTRAEAAAATLVSFPAAAIVLAYCTDAIGLTLYPIPILVVALGTATAVGFALGSARGEPVEPRAHPIARPSTSSGRAVIDGDLLAFVASVASVAAWLLWLAWPHLLPIGGGSDLTHHLLLIDYIDRTGRLVHDRAMVPYLGEMLDYTPGAHLLAVLAGRWMHSDGLHAVYPVVALSVALKAGVVLLIALRCVPPEPTRVRVPVALVAVVCVFLPRVYFLGSFTHDSFLAQVVSELFAAMTWWAIVCWDQQPTAIAAAIVGVVGAATFLTWPVWIGPMIVTFVAVAWLRRDHPGGVRVRHIAIAVAPIVAIATLHAAGRLGATAIAGASGFAPIPTPAITGWVFPVAGVLGTLAASADRRARTVPLLLAAIGLQAALLVVVARASRAEAPYLALKMCYLAIYPLAVAGAYAASVVFRSATVRRSASVASQKFVVAPRAARRPADKARGGRISGICDRRATQPAGMHRRPNANELLRCDTRASRSIATLVAWAIAALLLIAIGRSVVATPRPAPVISDALLEAGRWARGHVPPSCVDYLVADDDSAYWLHLVVLGNPRAATRSLASETFEPQQALVRWILPGGLPYAIAADVDALPRDIRTNVDVLARFGPAGVIKRRGESSCPVLR